MPIHPEYAPTNQARYLFGCLSTIHHLFIDLREGKAPIDEIHQKVSEKAVEMLRIFPFQIVGIDFRTQEAPLTSELPWRIMRDNYNEGGEEDPLTRPILQVRRTLMNNPDKQYILDLVYANILAVEIGAPAFNEKPPMFFYHP